jgi:hypothetical protein
MAILAVAGSAFAAQPHIVANATFAAGSPATTNNDDSCDISVAPAATLLLPYFEVDLGNAAGETTLFTITNVSQQPQIAHVTVWTDRSFPVLDFNIFLTGYDVQSINLFDVISRGLIAPPTGTTSDSAEGDRSLDNDTGNQNSVWTSLNCDRLAVNIREPLLSDLKAALTTGRLPSGGSACAAVGNVHTNAIGYLTVDVAPNCNIALPVDAAYYVTNLLYDNVLIGDYQQVNSTQNFAQGNPMVHIRAVPEGGNPGVLTTNFTRTFYSRYQSGGTADRRQPLPSTFAARWINGGSTAFFTSFKIWREGVTLNNPGCAVSGNASIAITEFVRFDEEENPTTFTPDEIISPTPPGGASLPETSKVSSANGIFPPNPDGAVAGWMYMNLDSGTSTNPPAGIASQNWVIISMSADGRYSVDYDAAWLGNGCSPIADVTAEDGSAPAIGPAANVTP